MSGMMIYTMYEYWPLNSALCTIWQVFDFAMCSVSMLHLCLIAFDRLVQGSLVSLHGNTLQRNILMYCHQVLGILLVHK